MHYNVGGRKLSATKHGMTSSGGGENYVNPGTKQLSTPTENHPPPFSKSRPFAWRSSLACFESTCLYSRRNRRRRSCFSPLRSYAIFNPSRIFHFRRSPDRTLGPVGSTAPSCRDEPVYDRLLLLLLLGSGHSSVISFR